MPLPKKVTICASMSFTKEIDEWRKKLGQDGYDVIQYPGEIIGDFLSGYRDEFSTHYEKMAISDIVLILNMRKNDKDGYIGAAVLAEIAFAIGLNITHRRDNPIEVCLLNPLPDDSPFIDELRLWQNLNWIKPFAA